ncbi:MAG: DUF1905 domain-containing protein [Chloroflexi bacterium]|nr:DUF1905 domain-containing protein [Chloroflexota bacterium]
MEAPRADPGQGWQEFTATIAVRGVNPYVLVPADVSRALASFGRAGRIPFEGTLNRWPFRGTLMPDGQGRHLLYVNGGIRAATAVGVGDTVSIHLRGVSPQDVALPPDVEAGLARVSGAPAGFHALSPPHRRELLRFIDDARTPAARADRIRETAVHVTEPRGAAKPMTTHRTRAHRAAFRARPLWTCPRCGNQFVTPNQYHSCAVHEAEESLAGKPEFVRELFDRFRALVEDCGPVRAVAYRDRVAFMVRVRFAGATPRQKGLDVSFWLTRRLESDRLRKVETLHPAAHIHTMRLTDPSQLDRELAGWIREAYAVGCEEHLRAEP